MEDNQENKISLEEKDFQEKLRQIFDVPYLFDFVNEKKNEQYD